MIRRRWGSRARFRDRPSAGAELARLLARHRGRSDTVVVGLPRGGVPVAASIAEVLDLPLDVIVVRKLGVPTQPELAMGAVGENGIVVVDRALVEHAGVSEADVRAVEERELIEVARRLERFRAGRPPVDLAGHTVLVVDDGVATGSTARAACQVARSAGAATIVLATPVAPRDWASRSAGVADEFVAVHTPAGFGSVGSLYEEFTQVADSEVVRILAERK